MVGSGWRHGCGSVLGCEGGCGMRDAGCGMRDAGGGREERASRKVHRVHKGREGRNSSCLSEQEGITGEVYPAILGGMSGSSRVEALPDCVCLFIRPPAKVGVEREKCRATGPVAVGSVFPATGPVALRPDFGRRSIVGRALRLRAWTRWQAERPPYNREVSDEANLTERCSKAAARLRFGIVLGTHDPSRIGNGRATIPGSAVGWGELIPPPGWGSGARRERRSAGFSRAPRPLSTGP